MPNKTHREVLIALRDWFSARQDGAEQVAAAALSAHMDLLPAPFAAASRPGFTLAESAVLNALDAYLQEPSNQPPATVTTRVDPVDLGDDVPGLR